MAMNSVDFNKSAMNILAKYGEMAKANKDNYYKSSNLPMEQINEYNSPILPSELSGKGSVSEVR